MLFGNENAAAGGGGVVNLSKGQKIDLTKGNPSLKTVLVGLGWDANSYTTGYDFDLDASAFMVDAQGKCQPAHFIFYNNLGNIDTIGVQSMGDNTTGSGDGDDEQIKIRFDKVPEEIQKIVITVTIFEAEERHQNFGMVSNAYVHVQDVDTGREVCRFDLGEDFSTETAVNVCELYRHNGEWKFNAVGAGYAGGLAAFVRNFGMSASGRG